MEVDKTARRVLGSLIEKRWTTPEQYPLTLNSLLLACNQKSNRDPEMQIEEFILEGVLYQLRLEGLVTIVERDVGRSTRYSERMSEKLDLSRQDQAILAELMLRGPQTAPELYRRCSRMADFKGPEEIEAILQGMASKHWTLLLPREVRQRDARWKHLFAPKSETSEDQTLQAVVVVPGPGSTEAPTLDAIPTQATVPPPAPRRAPWFEEIAELRGELDALRAEVAELRARLDRAGG